jgi:hypothetical protein
MDATSFINKLIYLAAAARIALLIRAVASGLIRRYPMFSALVMFSLVRGLWAVISPGTYRSFFDATRWPMALLEAAAILEAFWILASHFRGMKGFAGALIGVIAAVASAAALVVRFLRAPTAPPILTFGMLTNVAFMVAVTLALVFFRHFRSVPIRRNAKLHALLLAVLLSCYFTTAVIGQNITKKAMTIANFLLNAGILVTAASWAIFMNRAGEDLPFEPPKPIPPDQFDAAQREYELSRDQLKRASDEAVRNLRPRGTPPAADAGD